jgi:hypothetical protein
MQQLILHAVTVMTISSHAPRREVALSGTYRLVSEQRTIVETGEVISDDKLKGLHFVRR